MASILQPFCRFGRWLKGLWTDHPTGKDGQPKSRLPRRTALIALGGGAVSLAGLLGGRATCWALGSGTVAQAMPFSFEPEVALAIGQAYGARPGVATHTVRHALNGKILAQLGTQGSLHDAARVAIEADLAAGNMVVADRWIVAETEAQLCCLLARAVA